MDHWGYLLIDLGIILILICGIWRFRTPQGARSGNLAAAFALLCALGVVLYQNPVLQPTLVCSALALGGLAGGVVALRVKMIQIPAMVAFQNGAGGLAAFLVAAVELTRETSHPTTIGRVAGIVGVAVGAATFSGSMIASARLANLLKQTPTLLPKHRELLLGILLVLVALGALAENSTGSAPVYFLVALVLFSMLLGVVFSIRIGGADMPVLISFLNAASGAAAAFCGIIIQSRLLIACGAVVAASGSILTYVMCKAMNRDLFAVFAGIQGKPAAVPLHTPNGRPEVAPPQTTDLPKRLEKPQQQDPLSRVLEAVKDANKVIIIPGYGMALAHAQFETVQLANRLRELGKEVKFAVHPLAGRMPGHMHVLLAEAEADPDLLFDLEEVNADFGVTDLALIVGACDVVNPAATTVENTPISGMPILAAQEAKRVLVCNLDGRPGYSGVDNPLYADPKTILMFGDAKKSLGRMLQALA